MMRHNRIFILCLMLYSLTYSQNEKYFNNQETRIIEWENAILEAKNDEEKINANDSLTKIIHETIMYPKSYKYDFTNLNYISTLQPRDKKFKIITWFIELENKNYNFYGLIQICKKNGNKCQIYHLQETDVNLKDDIYSELNYDQWYGCIYYDIIETKINKFKYYTLLGWDGHNDTTTKKIIDVIKINKNMPPKFGAKIFHNETRRIIIEYSKKYSVSLKWDESIESIVFDHLEPIDGISEGDFSLYVPNLSYDILKKTETGWQLITNTYLNNSK